MSGSGTRVTAITLLLLAVALLAGCSTLAGAGDNPRTAGAPSSSEPTAQAEPEIPGVEAQIALVTGRQGVVLQEVAGADAWLGGAELKAYADAETHDEFIVDESRGMLLAYDPGTTIYQEPATLNTFPGEPSREEITALADQWATKYAPRRDISSMRRTARRRVCGNSEQGETLEWLVEYRRYVGGIRVTEWAHVTVTLPTWTWAPSRNVFEHVEEYEAVPKPRVNVAEALDTAAESTGYDSYVVRYAYLMYWKGSLCWSFQLEDPAPDANSFGGEAAWVRVDALTGTIIGTDFCG